MRRTGPAVIGVTTALFAVACGHLVARLLSPAASPIAAVAAVVVDAVPAWLKQWAIAVFGTADKTVLLIGVTLGVLVLAAGAGVLETRRRGFGVAAFALIGGLGIAAAMTRASAGALDWLPGAVAIAAAWGALTFQLRAAGAEAPGPQTSTPQPGWDRRGFLVSSASTLAGAGIVGAAGQAVAPPTPIQAVAIPPVADPLAALPQGLGDTVPGITALRTPVPDFYRIDIALTVPRIDWKDWQLRVDGLVDAPFTLSFSELLDLPMIQRDITLTCVSNEIGGALCGATRWQGVAVADLLRRASAQEDADMVLSAGDDGFSAGTPLAVLLDGRDAMIAIAMDGQPLTREHGAPARLLTPGLYGYVGATKWLRQLTVTRFADTEAYWTRRGWSPRGPVKTATRIDTPTRRVPAGPVPIGGVAWATHRGISGVQVRVDDGPWQQATLGPAVGVDYWQQWYLRWDAEPGRHTLTARAVDGDGQVQTAEEAPVIPDGASGYHSVQVTVR